MEYTALRKDGTTFPVATYSAPILVDRKPVGIRGVVIDVSSLRTQEKLLEKQKSELNRLSSRLIEIQERDCAFIARQLHDIVGQKISLARIKVEKALLDIPDNYQAVFQSVSSIISEIGDDIRHIMTSLHPRVLDELGLVSAIKCYLDEFQQSTGMAYRINQAGDEYQVPSMISVNLYRILQEIILNSYKHSRATELRIKVNYEPERIVMIVSDNGCGFDVSRTLTAKAEPAGFGLINMQERVNIMGGQIEIKSQKNEGTTVLVLAPREWKYHG
jgi:signal transduction histidine kinase